MSKKEEYILWLSLEYVDYQDERNNQEIWIEPDDLARVDTTLQANQITELFHEVVRGSDIQSMNQRTIEIQQATKAQRLIDHVLAMADDKYLEGHPEWTEIVNDARALQNMGRNDQPGRSTVYCTKCWTHLASDYTQAGPVCPACLDPENDLAERNREMMDQVYPACRISRNINKGVYILEAIEPETEQVKAIAKDEDQENR